MDELWYGIPGFPGYEFSSHYRVKSKDRVVQSHRNGKPVQVNYRGKILKFSELGNGYKTVTPCNEKGQRTFYLHELVMLVFGPPCPGVRGSGSDDWTIDHIDNDKTNNDISNLQWIRHHKNTQKASGSTLSKDDIRSIRERYTSGEANQYELAQEFGVGQSMISSIINRKRWGHVK